MQSTEIVPIAETEPISDLPLIITVPVCLSKASSFVSCPCAGNFGFLILAPLQTKTPTTRISHNDFLISCFLLQFNIPKSVNTKRCSVIDTLRSYLQQRQEKHYQPVPAPRAIGCRIIGAIIAARDFAALRTAGGHCQETLVCTSPPSGAVRYFLFFCDPPYPVPVLRSRRRSAGKRQSDGY